MLNVVILSLTGFISPLFYYFLYLLLEDLDVLEFWEDVLSASSVSELSSFYNFTGDILCYGKCRTSDFAWAGIKSTRYLVASISLRSRL
jgi:hypothetical protein